MRFITFAMALSTVLAASFAAPFPPANDPNLALWDGPADVWFPAEAPQAVVNKAAWAAWQWGEVLEYLNKDGKDGHDKGFRALLSNAAVHAMEVAVGPDTKGAIVWKGGLRGTYCPEVVTECPAPS